MKSIVYACLGLLLCLVFRFHDRFSSALEVVFFDVGQGDSALIQMPNGRVIVLDGGDGFFLPKGRLGGTAGRELFQELTRKAIRTIDHLVLTHGDRDHCFGLFTLFKHFQIHKFTFGSAPRRGEGHSSLHNLLKKMAEIHGVEMEEISKITGKEEGGVRLTLLPVAEGKWERNNQSLVMRLEFGLCSLLFTGDIERKREAAMANTLAPVDILKVPHHGSRTSSTRDFIERLSPRVAVISVGRDNRYGHPHDSVVWRLQHFGAEVFRTDFHGYVSFKITPQGKVTCRSSLGDCGGFFCTSNSHLPLLKY